MKYKNLIERPDLSLAEKVEYFEKENYLKFYFPQMIFIVPLPKSGLQIIGGPIA